MKNDEITLSMLRISGQHLANAVPIFLTMLTHCLDADQEDPAYWLKVSNAALAAETLQSHCNTIAKLLASLEEASQSEEKTADE